LATLRAGSAERKENFQSQAVAAASTHRTDLPFLQANLLSFNSSDPGNRRAIGSFVSRVCGNVDFFRGNADTVFSFLVTIPIFTVTFSVEEYHLLVYDAV
jgi:hypothetical protein